MAPDSSVTLRKLMKEHRIEFDNQGYPDSWPAPYKRIFTSIQQLGEEKFEWYHASVDVDSEERPWRAKTKIRARWISELANRLLKTESNEAGWRLSVESLILARFTIEVNCRNCRARLWRSEIEADTCGGTANGLEQRRKRRTPCSCGPNGKSQDEFEQGLNPLFDDRAEEIIQYEEAIAEALRKRQKPDRIYGLKETTNLNRLLSKTVGKDGRFIEDSISSSPFPSNPEPLLFPFLILEAKSGKSSDSFTDIEAQSAFAIRALLKLQADLKDATEQDCQWDTEPLVWFFANKGQHWRLSVAYSVQEKEVIFYRVTDLWHGEINKVDDALQLLLIMDYIFDWARDCFRETIVKQLRCLAANDTPSLAGDCDIFSCADNITPWMDGLTSPNGPELVTQQVICSDVPEVLKTFDGPKGVIRDARFFQAHLYALRVDENSLSKVLESANTPAQSQKLARDLQRFLQDAVRVEESTLDQLESLWTGVDSHGTMMGEPGRMFLVKVCMAAYFTPKWEQVVELTYVALDEAAVGALKGHADMARRWVLDPTKLPLLSDTRFLREPRLLRHSSSQRDILLACITQRCWTIHSKMNSVKPTTYHDPQSGVMSMRCLVSQLEASMDGSSKSAQTRSIVFSIYKRYKIGMRQPSEDFIRHSLCRAEQASDESGPMWQEGGNRENVKQQIPEDENLVCIKDGSHGSRVCLYLLDGPADYSNLPEIISLKMDLSSQYSATLEGTPRWDHLWNKSLRDVRVPICSLKEKFTGFNAAISSATKEAIDLVAAKQELSAEDILGIERSVFPTLLGGQLLYLRQEMSSARVAAPPAPPASTNECSPVEDNRHDEAPPTPLASTTECSLVEEDSHDEGISASGETQDAGSCCPIHDSNPRKRLSSLIDEEDGTLPKSAKRLSIRPSNKTPIPPSTTTPIPPSTTTPVPPSTTTPVPPSNTIPVPPSNTIPSPPSNTTFARDWMDDQEVEALLRTGCFGGSDGLEGTPTPGLQAETSPDTRVEV